MYSRDPREPAPEGCRDRAAEGHRHRADTNAAIDAAAGTVAGATDAVEDNAVHAAADAASDAAGAADSPPTGCSDRARDLPGERGLAGPTIRLEPLEPRHRDGLLQAAGRDAGLFEWLPAVLTTPEAVDEFIAAALAERARGAAQAFAVVRRADDRVLGSTRYMDIDAQHRTLEVGWTWYAREAWGTQVNPEAKYLLLQHAFEVWGAHRVTLKTDHMNLRSQAAIRKLGAQYEGTLRNHRVRRDGSLRHTVIFSILPEEWPAVKEGLLRRLAWRP